ncbi:MAG: 2-phosphosulfolactate phosphatase [Parachlamydiaceae bacterium]|nr:2-phosphosulfolactate phosphatase [Parachlamydiaceae bacterium]
MEINIYRRNECYKAKGCCVVIDVLRAFTTAAYAFDAGAKEIILVSTAEEAFQMHQEDHSLILMGEVQGRPIQGFHYGNSPDDMHKCTLVGQRIVQRTSAGTQGVVDCSHADQLLIASFVVADATLQRIIQLSPANVSFIVTGMQNGDEDLALAEYLKSKLLQQKVCSSSYLERVSLSPEGKTFRDPNNVEFSHKDLELALQIDRFCFAMEVEKLDGNLVAKKIFMSPSH